MQTRILSGLLQYSLTFPLVLTSLSAYINEEQTDLWAEREQQLTRNPCKEHAKPHDA